ncbi:MAG: hypothetical protein MK142_12170, partial [Pseudomonadales bacterium]|nr:hypothetical protein [Pseudomonadales bacterium]
MASSKSDFVVETERLHLAPFTQTDVDALHYCRILPLPLLLRRLRLSYFIQLVNCSIPELRGLLLLEA